MNLLYTTLLSCTLGFAGTALACSTAKLPAVSQTWLDYVQAQGQGKPYLIPDYSYAGYHFGEKAVPEVKYRIFNVCDFGAIPNDGQSDRIALEQTIAAAEQHGSGIIFFPKGQYHLRPKDAPNTPITIRSGHIVLRGEGRGKGGTELFMEFPNPATDPKKLWTSPTLLLFKGNGVKEPLAEVKRASPAGVFTIEVSSTDRIRVGDWVTVEAKNNDPALLAQELAPYDVEQRWTNLTKEGAHIYQYQLVTHVEGNRITFKTPMIPAIDPRWGWVVRRYNPIEEVGVEDIAFKGNFHEPFVHHKNWLHDGGYTMLTMNNVLNSWIRRCSFTDVSNAATVSTSAQVSVYNCEVLGNQGHAAIKSQGSTRVFLGNLLDEPAQWHSIGVAKPSIGTVIWRTRTNSNSCFECHASQPRYTLFDSCEGGFMRFRAGGAIQSNPNHLQGLLFWNYHQTNEGTDQFDFWATDTPYWRFVMPLFVGFHNRQGKVTNFVQDQVLLDESHGQVVTPESLYEAQLQLRLGDLPEWLRQLKTELYIQP